MNQAQRRAAQLGMPYGTANARLRKNILFSLLERLEENICFRCGEKIEYVETLSIEHIEPWENRDPALFWSMDNISFSHLSCNVPHTRKSGNSHFRENAPQGTKWCAYCQSYKTHEKFHRCSSYQDGLDKRCKECAKNNLAKYR